MGAMNDIIDSLREYSGKMNFFGRLQADLGKVAWNVNQVRRECNLHQVINEQSEYMRFCLPLKGKQKRMYLICSFITCCCPGCRNEEVRPGQRGDRRSKIGQSCTWEGRNAEHCRKQGRGPIGCREYFEAAIVCESQRQPNR